MAPMASSSEESTVDSKEAGTKNLLLSLSLACSEAKESVLLVQHGDCFRMVLSEPPLTTSVEQVGHL